MRPILLALLTTLAVTSGYSQSDESPNIVFIFCDDLNRLGNGSVVDPLLHTPNIDSLRDQSVAFFNAHANAAGCGPSRASIFSGVLPQTSGHFGYRQRESLWFNNPYLENTTSVFEQFKENGYLVYASGKVYHAGRHRLEDFDEFFEEPDQGPTAYDRRVHSDMPPSFEAFSLSFAPLENIPSYPEYTGWQFRDGSPFFFESDENRDLMGDELTAVYCDSLFEAYAAGDMDEPFFLTAGLYNPHEPFHVPQKYWDLYDPEEFDLSFLQPDDEVPSLTGVTNRYNSNGESAYDLLIEEAPDNDSLAYWKSYIHGYYASVSFVDDQVGAILASLENHGLADNTIVIFSSDHGFHLGSKGLVKKSTMWNDATGIPFMFRVPGVAPQILNDPVSLVDFYPTVLEFANIPPPASHPLDGQPLQALFNGGGGTAVLSAMSRELLEIDEPSKNEHNHHAFLYENYKYMLWSSGEDELYDIEADPGEVNDLSDQVAFQDLRNALYLMLRDRIGFIQPPLPEYECLYYGDFEQDLNGWSTTEPDQQYALSEGDANLPTSHLVISGPTSPNLSNRNLKITEPGVHRLTFQAYSESPLGELELLVKTSSSDYLDETFQLGQTPAQYEIDFTIPEPLPEFGDVRIIVKILNPSEVHIDDIRIINVAMATDAFFNCEDANPIQADVPFSDLTEVELVTALDQPSVECGNATGAAKHKWLSFVPQIENGIVMLRGLSEVRPAFEVYEDCSPYAEPLFCSEGGSDTEAELLTELEPGTQYFLKATDVSLEPESLGDAKSMEALYINAYSAEIANEASTLTFSPQESLELEPNPVFNYPIESVEFKFRNRETGEILTYVRPFQSQAEYPITSFEGLTIPEVYRVSVRYTLATFDITVPYGAERTFFLQQDQFEVLHPFVVVPNPSPIGGTTIQLVLPEPPDRIGTIDIFDLSGRQVYSRRVMPSAGVVSIDDLPDLSAGSYLILYQVEGSLLQKSMLLIQ